MNAIENKTRGASPLLTIFLTVFIDMLGVSIIIPVIPAIFFSETSTIFPPEVSQDQRSILYGFLLASYPILQFFGAPLLGSFSDRYGRKPVLQLSLLGTLTGYLLFAVAILSQNLWLLFLARMLPGFTGGNISIILSSISDVSDEQSKVRNFGLVGMAFGMGFILGPAIGGILADDTVVSWFTPATPFWFTALLAVGNILLVRWRFRETLVRRRESRISLLTGFRNVGKSFRSPNLRTIFTVVLLLSLGFAFFTQFFSVLLIQQFGYTEKNIGLLYGWIGLWLAFTQGVTVRQLSKRYTSSQLLPYSILLLSLALGALLLPDQSFWFYLINPLVATFQGITTPNLTATVSAQARGDQQGEILGINQSMLSLGQAIPPIIAGYINTINEHLPILSAALFTLAGWLVYILVFKRQQPK